MSNYLRVAGIDPSYRNFGMVKGVLCLKSGVLDLQHLALQETNAADKNTKKTVRTNSTDLGRARLIHNALHDFINDVDMVFVEMPVGSQSAASMKGYGVCIMAVASITKPIIQVMPNEVKMASVGNKNATKKQMIDWAVGEYPKANWLTRKQQGKIEIVGKNEHLADALAVIYAGVRTDEFKHARSVLTLNRN